MYICDKCGKRIEELAIYTQYEKIDNVSVPTMEYDLDNCGCGGEYQEATKCPVCGKWFTRGKNDCCDNCFEEHLTKENCVYAGNNFIRKSNVKLNEFWVVTFSEREIEEILEREFDRLEDYEKKKHMRYYAEDNDDFIKAVLERKKYDDIHKRKDNG